MKTIIRIFAYAVGAYFVLIGVGRLLQTDRGTLIVVGGGFALVMALVIRAATRTRARIRPSGRNLRDIDLADSVGTEHETPGHLH